jgi:hypothetical protein
MNNKCKVSNHTVVVFLSAIVFCISSVNISLAQAKNIIQLENSRAGATDWLIGPNTGSSSIHHEIEGYASATSVNRGETITLFVNTSASSFTFDVYRLGWYGGAGARRIMPTVTISGNSVQPSCPVTDPTGVRLVECNWTSSDPKLTFATSDTNDSSSWVSGIYIVKLTAIQGVNNGKQSYIIFAVRDDQRHSDLILQQAVTTYQAYNTWSSNFDPNDSSTFISLYTTPAALKVSFNRPYSNLNNEGPGSSGLLNGLDGYEYSMIRFLEREGYDVSYATDLDAHERGDLFLNHKGILIVGHSEYWSMAMRDTIVNARNSGVNIGFFAANTIYWQVRFEPSSTGTSDRTMVGYKEFAFGNQTPLHRDLNETDPSPIIIDPFATYNNDSFLQATTNWQAAPVNSPEDVLLGVRTVEGPVGVFKDIVVYNTNTWIFNGTGLTDGSHLSGLLGYEVDFQADHSPANNIRLGHSPVDNSGTQYSDMVQYSMPLGNIVFSTGSIQWSWGLDSFVNDPCSGGSGQPNHCTVPVSGAAQQITRNILNRFLQPISSSIPTRSWMTYPVNNATDVLPNIRFTWTYTFGASAYRLRYGTDPTCQSFTNDTGSISTISYTPPQVLQANTTYCAKLSILVNGNWIDSSDVIIFTTSLRSVLLAPANNAINVPQTNGMVTFTWTPLPGIFGPGQNYYYVKIGSRWGSADVNQSGEIYVCCSWSSHVDTGGPWYVRLYTFDKANGALRFTDSVFTVAPQFSYQFSVMTSPQDGSTNIPVSATMTWSTVPSAINNFLYVGTFPGKADVMGTGEITTNSTLVNHLRGGAQHYLRIWTQESDGGWPWSDISITAAQQSELVQPANNAVLLQPVYRAAFGGPSGARLPMLFQWTQVLGAQTYFLYIGSSCGIDDVFGSSETLATSMIVNLRPNTTYCARIWTKDSNGTWRIGPADITFMTSPLSMVTSPSDNATGVTLPVQISWTSVPTVAAYFLYVGSAPGLADVYGTGEIQTTTVTISNLQAGKLYYLRLWTKDSVGGWRYTDSTFTTNAL